MKSVWVDNTKNTGFSRLEGNKKTDILIIGGGITGILCAYMLKKSGVDCILTEATYICDGITKNTTAKITLQHGLIYDKFINKYGEESARLYLEAQKKACEEYKMLCRDIDCDYELKDSYVYSLKNRKAIENEVKALNRLGLNAEFVGSPALPFETAGSVRIKEQAQFHPLKFLYAIAKDLPVYENTRVLELMPYKAITQHGEISCKKIIVATHFPFLDKHGLFPLKMYQHRSYVLALEGAEQLNGMYVDEADKGMSFRNYKNLLFIGGGDHRTGKKGGNWHELEDFAGRFYPSAKILNRWATQDCMTLDGIPYIGLYSKNTPDMFVATGFNKWGISSSMVSAAILSDMVQGKHNEYAPVFDPSRSILHPQLAVNAFETIVNMLTPTAPRCPHLGCALKYNAAEHSWDCPCHGSRFDDKGKLTDNPADHNLHR